MRLTPREAPCSLDPGLWTETQAGWVVHKGSALARFCANTGLIQLQFRRPRRQIEWSVDVTGEKHRIDYRLSQNQFERKVVGIKGQDKKYDIRTGADEFWSIEINIQPDRISITSKGTLLDEYRRPDPATPLGMFGFRGDVELRYLNQH